MARYVRSIRDKLHRLVTQDSGPQFQETLHALLADDMLDRDEMTSLLGEALRTAARVGSTKSLNVLLYTESLQDVLNVNSADTSGHNALMLSVLHGHQAVSEELLEHMRCNVLLRNNNGTSAMDLAARDGHLQAMLQIAQAAALQELDHGASEMFWYTAITTAAENGQIQALNMMLQRGVDPNANLDQYIGTPMHCAVEYGSMACVELLLRYGADVESLRRCVLQSPLMRACEYGHVDIVLRLIHAGAAIDRQTPECSTALTIACHYGQQDVVQVLLKHGAAPHVRNRWGFTPLYMATDTPSIVARLLQEEVDVNEACGDRNEAPLHLAAVIGTIHSFQLLLDYGANINILTAYNESPLWLAIWKGNTDIIKMCIQENCKLNIPSNGCQVYLWHYTPMELALGSGNLEVADTLYNAGCSFDNPMYFPPGSAAPLPALPGVKLREEILQYVQQDRGADAWLGRAANVPRSLKQWCRIAIRAALGGRLARKVRLLPLPPVMQRYVLME